MMKLEKIREIIIRHLGKNVNELRNAFFVVWRHFDDIISMHLRNYSDIADYKNKSQIKIKQLQTIFV